MEQFIPIRGSDLYLISSTKEIKNEKTGEIVSSYKDQAFKISLYGMEERSIFKEWLWWFSLIDYIVVPDKFKELIFKLSFYGDMRTKARYSKFPLTPEPLPVPGDDEKRLVPGMFNLAVDSNGIIYKLNKVGEFEVVNIYRDKNIYPRIIGKDGRTIPVHRLVALAWCRTNDLLRYCVVDHIDGDKNNFAPSNLRWATYQDNSAYTKEQGLRTDNFEVLLFNVDTKEVSKALSITDACKIIGRSRISQTNGHIRPGRIWFGENGRFEMKYANSLDDWVYIDKSPDDYKETRSSERNKSKSSLSIKIPGEKLRVYRSIEELFEDVLPDLELTNTNISNVKSLVEERYPGSIFMDNMPKEYEAKNLETGDIVTEASIGKIAIKIGIPKSTAIKYVALKKPYNGWFIRLRQHEGEEPWPDVEEVLPTNTTIQYLIENVYTGEKEVIDSKRKLSERLSAARHALNNYIDIKPYREWKITTLGRTRQDLSTDNKRSFKTGKYIKSRPQ